MLAPGHNTNIQTFSEKMITHTRNHWLTTRLRLQTKIFCMDEKGVQVVTETGTMLTKGSIVTDCESVVYLGNERGIFFYFGWTNRKYIFFPTRCRRSVASCVNEMVVCVIIHPWPCFFNMCIALPFLLIVSSNFNIIRTKLQFVRYFLQRYFMIICV